MKRRKIITTVLIIVLFVGISMLLYPIFAKRFNARYQIQAISEYQNVLEETDDETLEAEMEKARAYNEALAALPHGLSNHSTLTGYSETLNPTGSGMMGYLYIDKLQLELPIYHTTESSVLNKGCGHIEGSSLPVGGESTHAVLSAHRGLATSKLFTDLDKMEIGDIFRMNIMGQYLTYRVDQIKTVLPDDGSDLVIEEGMDYVTLLTCTPYAVNTHRLLVRGVRVEENEKVETPIVTSDAYLLDAYVMASVIAVPILVLLILIVWLKPAKTTLPEKYRAEDEIE